MVDQEAAICVLCIPGQVRPVWSGPSHQQSQIARMDHWNVLMDSIHLDWSLQYVNIKCTFAIDVFTAKLRCHEAHAVPDDTNSSSPSEAGYQAE